MEQYPNIESVALFIRVVEAGSFAKVSRMLGIPKASLSRKISQLEDFYGAQLIIRTTRHLQLSEIGREVFSKSHAMLSILEETKSAVLKTKEKPHGLLRISAGVEYGLSVMSPIVNQYLKRYPEVSVELDLTGRRVDLVYEGFDLGVRIGPLEDSTLSTRKIGSFRYGIFASQKFVSENKPVTLERIRTLPTMGFTRAGNQKTWTLIHSLDQKTIDISPRVLSNNYWALLNAVKSHLGIAFMPVFLFEEELKKKTIVHLFNNWQSEEIPVHFIYPSQKYLTSKVRNFIDFAVEKLK
jgi:LysR family transcriptional regulator, regulator for bpeEF and oprC